MKIKKLGIMLCSAFFIFGCSSEGFGSKSIIDKESAAKLSTDNEIQDFILDGQVYELPCSLKSLIDQGWKVNEVNDLDEELNDIQLKQNTKIALNLENDAFKLSEMRVEVFNDSEQPISLYDDSALVHSFVLDLYESESAVPFVLKGGITNGTSQEDADAILLELGKQIDPKLDDDTFNEGVLKAADYTIILTLGYKEKHIDSISLGDTARSLDYLEHESSKQQKERVANKKQDIQSVASSYNGNYKKILDTVSDKDNTDVVKVHFEVTIKEEVLVETSFGFGTGLPSGSAYLVTDSQGNLYSLSKTDGKKDYIAWPELQIGQTIDIWAVSTDVLHMDDSGSNVVPSLIANIIESNGEMIYRSY